MEGRMKGWKIEGWKKGKEGEDKKCHKKGKKDSKRKMEQGREKGGIMFKNFVYELY